MMRDLFMRSSEVFMAENPTLYLAPVQGVTSEDYQTLYDRHFPGMDGYMAPFVKVRMQGNLGKAKKSLLPKSGHAFRLIPQLLSNQAEEFLQFDAYLQDAGYAEMNWNLGCPMPMVTRKRRGSGLLPHPDMIRSVLETIMPRMQCALSIKARLGYAAADELLELLPVLNQYPLQSIIIHARLGNQGYRGTVDLETFGKCLALSRHPVVYNGDIFDLETFRSLQQRFPGVAGWMLGRGALANPFLAGQIKGRVRTDAERRSAVEAFHAELGENFLRTLSGPAHFKDKLFAVLNYQQHLFSDGKTLLNHLKKCRHSAECQSQLAAFFSRQPEIKTHLDMTSEDF